ncbi:MAG: T9SS type A sorting domain-containing protein [Ignavibacteriaceae bacterium]
MKVNIFLPLLISLAIATISFAQYIPPAPPPASQDTIYIPGGTMNGAENAGSMEATINSDTLSGGLRVNPNRVYALFEGRVYYQLAPIKVYNPTGTLTIAGVSNPDSPYSSTKPIILIQPTHGKDVIINNSAVNEVYGSIKFINVHYQTMQLDGYQNNELFYCGTADKLPQSLTIDNCLFEFCNIDLFDCTNESGAIGGWPNGAKFRITNSYFRNMFYPGQWWGSRVFQCKHPIDTLWIENCTTTTGGLTFLQQVDLTAFAYFNHNTIVNNKKYWIYSKYYKKLFVTNNIFINQNWVGEDTNIVKNENPLTGYQSTIDIDTVSTAAGVVVQSRYYAGDSSHYSEELAPENLSIYISNNINYYDTLLINGYYNSSAYKNSSLGTLPSYLNWFGFGNGPWKIGNVPCMWMNNRTKALFTKYSPPNGGFVEEYTSTADPQTLTPGIADASVVTDMAVWNQNQWSDPKFKSPGTITSSKYIYGDYNPKTLPGIINGKSSDSVIGEGPGIQVGITKFTDLTENFSQTVNFSKIDNLPVGSLIWDDAQLNAYNSTVALNAVNAAYIAAGGSQITGTKEANNLPHKYLLLQNYPNPFNPGTNISFALEKSSNVMLTVYNILGQQVATVVNGFMKAGNYTYRFDAGKLASGVYFYRIEAGEFVSVKKMILLK